MSSTEIIKVFKCPFLPNGDALLTLREVDVETKAMAGQITSTYKFRIRCRNIGSDSICRINTVRCLYEE